MRNVFTVHSETIETFTGKKGEQKSRRLMLLDASDGSRLSQIVEMNLPAEHPAVGLGKKINVEIGEFSSIFSGRPRIRGIIVGDKVG